ncbi:MAG TPA: hypothetical protein VIV57_16410 [Anaeromyxobacter sp.]
MRRLRARVLPCAAALALAGSFAAGPARAAAPVRKGGTAKVTLAGAKTASGTFEAVCGSYFMMDVPGVAKAGDGLVFETEVAGVGRLQLNSEKRIPGRAAKAGLILNAKDASYVGDAGAPNEIVFGPRLDAATVRATLRNLRFRRGAPPDVITIRAEFDCSK